jgi:hypothetical protein
MLMSRKEIQRISTPAILDAKWYNRPFWRELTLICRAPILINGNPQLAVADAMGHVTLYTLTATGVSGIYKPFLRMC